MSELVLLTGATGYVGARLLSQLVRAERRVRCLARWPENLHGRVPEGVEVVHGDACDAASLAPALSGVEAAFYLVHALGTSGDAAEFDRRAARAFGAAARAAGMRRIVYFGGFGPPPAAGAPRGRVDQDVGDALRASGVPVVELRASVIIGPGSLSFEMIRALVERMPVIAAPRWLRTPVRPIFSGDVLAYLLAALDLPATESRTFAIGGRDIVSYAELMREYARQRGLRRWIIPVSVDAPRVSSLWLAMVTPLYARIGRTLIDSVRHPIVADDAALRQFAVQPIGVREAIARAMRSEEAAQARTSGLYGVAAEDALRRWGGARFGNRLVDSRVVAVPATPAAAFAAIERIGGDRGWYSTRWLWQLRGWMDQLVGGVGMRRGRRDPERLAAGEVLDCWRVAAVERGKRLLLAAEMKLPGRGWLEFEVRPGDGDRTTAIRQTATFDPLGLAGLLYWYVSWPLHQWVFAQMARGVALEAQKLEAAGGRADVAASARALADAIPIDDS